MKIVFAGTPAFTVPTLERLVADSYTIQAVFTQPDRPVGREQQMQPPPVKQAAQKLGLPVHQPEKIKSDEALSLLESIHPDVVVVVGYGQILPPWLLELPLSAQTVSTMVKSLDWLRKRFHETPLQDEWAYPVPGRGEPAGGASPARLRARWSQSYPAMVRPLEKDWPQRLRFLQFPRHLWSKLRTTNLIERCLAEVRRRTRPLVCFGNLHSVDRII